MIKLSKVREPAAVVGRLLNSIGHATDLLDVYSNQLKTSDTTGREDWLAQVNRDLKIMRSFRAQITTGSRARKRVIRKPRLCEICRRAFIPLRSDGRFCRGGCRVRAWRAAQG